MPLLILVGGFGTKQAIPLSNVTILVSHYGFRESEHWMTGVVSQLD